jgi:WD40 repeat protein
MGGGVSVYTDENVLASYKDVDDKHLNARYRIALEWSTEILDREYQQCSVQGFNSTSPYAQPLMMEKMERSLSCLDDVCMSHCDDQQRSQGHAEVRSEALSGTPQVICPLGDDSTLAWAASDGPIWVYNWREGLIISQMRDDQAHGAHDTTVHRLCSADDNYRYLASGDENGVIELWDLTRPRCSVFDVRLHEQAITGLQCEHSRNWLMSTSQDTYITIFDLVQQQVVESAAPKSCDCGSGIPNSILGMSQEQPNIMLVGGQDGKLRIWSKGDGLRRLHTLFCNGGQATSCRIASDGWRCVVGTVPANGAHCDVSQVSHGGLLAYDLRCLGGDQAENRALVATWDAGPGPGSGSGPHFPAASTTGIVDMELVEEGGEVQAICIVDNTIRSFNLDANLAISPGFQSPARSPKDSGAHLCALGACERFIFLGTSTPSVNIWRRTRPDELHGHKDHIRTEQLAPMLLRATCLPLQLSRRDLAAGAVLSHVEDALEADKQRLAAKMASGAGKCSKPQLTNPVGDAR